MEIRLHESFPFSNPLSHAIEKKVITLIYGPAQDPKDCMVYRDEVSVQLNESNDDCKLMSDKMLNRVCSLCVLYIFYSVD